VVGQLLDYAANAVVYWPLNALRDSLASRAAQLGKTIEQLFNEFRPDLDPEQFWEKVESNLKLGHVRMIFAADSLPPELVRIIEFLNEQMSPAEVLGVELLQFRAGDHIAYVPRVVGQTTAAAQAKSSGGGVAWTRERFLEAASDRCSDAEKALIERLLKHVDTHGVRLSWGRGVTPGVGGWYMIDGRPTGAWVLNLNSESPTTKAYLVFYYGDVANRAGPHRVERSAERLRAMPGMQTKIEAARAANWSKYPSIYLSDVASDASHVEALLDAIDDLVEPGQRVALIGPGLSHRYTGSLERDGKAKTTRWGIECRQPSLASPARRRGHRILIPGLAPRTKSALARPSAADTSTRARR
jgi:hypothetical protein